LQQQVKQIHFKNVNICEFGLNKLSSTQEIEAVTKNIFQRLPSWVSVKEATETVAHFNCTWMQQCPSLPGLKEKGKIFAITTA